MWIFNPLSASHIGRMWDRQIPKVRKELNSLRGQQNLHDESFNNLFCEAGSIVISKPITVVSDNPNELQALTRNHLLSLPPGDVLPQHGVGVKDRYRRQRMHSISYQHILRALARNNPWVEWWESYLEKMSMSEYLRQKPVTQVLMSPIHHICLTEFVNE